MTTLLSTQKTKNCKSKLAGLTYLIIAVIGGLSIGYFPTLLNEKESLEQYQNVKEIFYWALGGDILVFSLEVVLTVLLYQILKKYHHTNMLIATCSRLGMAIVMAFNLMNYLVPILILNQAVVLENQLALELIEISLRTHEQIVFVWQIFFFLHLLFVGITVNKTHETPNWLGSIITIGSFGYLIDAFLHLFNLELDVMNYVSAILLTLVVVAEFWFAFWLLLRKEVG